MLSFHVIRSFEFACMEGSVSRTSKNMESLISRIPDIEQKLLHEYVDIFGSLELDYENLWELHSSGGKGKDITTEVQNTSTKNIADGNSSHSMEEAKYPSKGIKFNEVNYGSAILKAPEQINFDTKGIEINEPRSIHESHTMNNSWNEKLIRRIKRTNHPYTLTRLLSTRLFELMTDNTSRTIIKQCLDHFGSRPNEVLYEKVILYHDEVILNECISTISGIQKVILLDKISDIAVFLSNDQYGNYVVQQAMTFGHGSVTAKILFRLQGHVVEKCVSSSNLGTTLVVDDILQTPYTPFQLSRHQFGNYVIQTALRNIKTQRNETLYFSLVKPHFRELSCNAGGKQVIDLIIGYTEIHY